MSLTLTLKDNGGNPVSGEGNSITLNNTTETNFTKFDLYGDTEQTTYSGKNLAKITDCNASGSGYTLKIANNTVDITSTGTNNWFDICQGARAATWVPSSSDAADYHLTPADGGTYTVKWWDFSGTNTSTGYNQFCVITNQRFVQRYYWNGQGADPLTTTFTLQEDEYVKVIGVWTRSDTTTTISFKVQLEKSSTATSFEPYVGGMASPNPDYPQEVKTVTGEQTITVSNGQGESQVYPINLGKNILDNYNPTVVSNNTTWTPTANGGLYTATSGWTGGVQWRLTVETGVTYQFQYKERTNQNLYLYITSYTDATYTTVKTMIVNDGRYTKYPIVPDSPYLVIKFNNSAAMTDVAVEELMFEKAPVRTTYAPYITAFGVNLVNPYTLTANGRLNGDGSVLTGATGFSTSDYIPVEPNTEYTITRNDAESGYFGNLCQYDSTKTKVGNREYWDNAATYWPYHITTSSTTHYLRVSDQTSLFGTSFQLQKGSTVTPYEPNMSGQLELCEIGDYQDYLYKSEGNWYVHKETNRISLDGSTEGTWWYGDESGHERFIVTYADIATQSPYAANTPKIQFSDSFEGSNGYHTYTGDMNNIMSGHHNNHQIIIRATQFTSLAAFTSWLGTNKPSMYYVKATPIDIQITYEPLVAQLEALYNTAQSYNGATIITSSSQYLPAIMDVTIGASTNEVTYTETELSNPLTITDIEGKSQNTTLNGNIYVDYVYNKKSFSVSIFNLKSADYATIRGFYDRQFTLNEFPLLSIPELNISEMPVFFEIGSREINSQCIVTDKLTLKFRETAQQ